MARGHVNSGATIPYTNSGAVAVASGDVVRIGVIMGVSLGDIPPGGAGEAAITGQWELRKAAGVAIVPGDRLFWDDAAKALTKTAANPAIGVASESSASAATTARVLLNVAV